MYLLVHIHNISSSEQPMMPTIHLCFADIICFNSYNNSEIRVILSLFYRFGNESKEIKTVEHSYHSQTSFLTPPNKGSPCYFTFELAFLTFSPNYAICWKFN